MKSITYIIMLFAISALSCSKTNDPVPSTPNLAKVTFTSFFPASAKKGELITITGTNFSPIISENTVNFIVVADTWTYGIVKQATTTTLIVEVPKDAMTGPLFIRVKDATSIWTNNVLTIIP